MRSWRRSNIQTLSGSFQGIVTTDPHSYNTIRNEYPRVRRQLSRFQHLYDTAVADHGRRDAARLEEHSGGAVHVHTDPCHMGRLHKGLRGDERDSSLLA